MNYPFQTKTNKMPIFGFPFPFFWNQLHILSMGYTTFNSKVMGKLKIRWWEASTYALSSWTVFVKHQSWKKSLSCYWKNYFFATVWLINGAIGNSRVWAGTMSNPYNTDTGFSRFSTCKTNGCLLFLVLQSFSFSLWKCFHAREPNSRLCQECVPSRRWGTSGSGRSTGPAWTGICRLTCGWFEVCMIHMYIYTWIICV